MMKVKFFIIVYGCFAKRHHATVPANPNMPVESKIIMLIKLKFEFCKNTVGIVHGKYEAKPACITLFESITKIKIMPIGAK